jgi:hypothetical protein
LILDVLKHIQGWHLCKRLLYWKWWRNHFPEVPYVASFSRLSICIAPIRSLFWWYGVGTPYSLFCGELCFIYVAYNSHWGVVILSFFTFWVPWCDVRYDFRIKTMIGSSLPLACKRAHVLLTLFVFVCA